MTTRLPFVFGGAVAMSLVAVLVIAKARPSRPPLIPPPPPTFVDRWHEPPLTPKAIRTIPISKPPPPAVKKPVVAMPTPPPAAMEAVPAPARAKRDREMGDICRGKGKRYTNNKRSWRCKR